MSDINFLNVDAYEESVEILELANLYRMQAVLGNMLVRVDETDGTSNARVVTVSNANLYALSSEYYGSPNQWTLIADANDLKDPYVAGIRGIIIPEWDGLDRGGEFGT